MSNTEVDVGTEQTDGRSTRWDNHKAERRDLILDAAVGAINELGADIGVSEIAGRADLPRSVVYRIFKDRNDLDEQLRARIVQMLMRDLAPTLAPEGAVDASISRAVDTYVNWIVAYPRLHAFLGKGSPKHRTSGSRVVTGAKTAIAVQLTGLLLAVARKQPAAYQIAEPLAFGLVGLVDASVNRWLNNPSSGVTSEQLAQFLKRSVWHLLDVNMRAVDIVIEPSTPIAALV